jgi:nitroreductase
MDFKDLAKKNRSYRRFDENFVVEHGILVELIGLARWAASGRNAQPLKYYLSNDSVINELIFSTLEWAGYLKNWRPAKGERPTAYIIVLLDRQITDNFYCDDGIAMQNILLGAVEKGLGGCIIRSINKPKLRTLLNVPPGLEIIDVVALGKPVEKVVLTDVGEDGNIKYYRDEAGVHYVPKRTIDELIVKF